MYQNPFSNKTRSGEIHPFHPRISGIFSFTHEWPHIRSILLTLVRYHCYVSSLYFVLRWITIKEIQNAKLVNRPTFYILINIAHYYFLPQFGFAQLHLIAAMQQIFTRQIKIKRSDWMQVQSQRCRQASVRLLQVHQRWVNQNYVIYSKIEIVQIFHFECAFYYTCNKK